MDLNLILKSLEYSFIKECKKEIKKIEYDSRNVEEGDLFVCIQGYATDGHKYAKKAYDNGAKVIVCEKALEDITYFKDCTIIKVSDTRKALAIMASNYYGNPSKHIKIIGITGTNGKTTSTFIIKSILEKAGYKVGLIGTIANYIGNKKIESHRTTPESLELQKLFKDMVDEEVDYCVMEVSSHSLYLDRVYGVEFKEAIFTNLTQDHLDFHKTFENYLNAKLILFKNTQNSIINIDDSYGEKVLGEVLGNKITYGVEKESDLKAKNLHMHSRGVEFDVIFKDEKETINLNIPGKYNIYNALGSIGACILEGISLKTIKEALENMPSVPGRCEIVTKNYNLGYDVIVDYAHTPDGLENILNTAREFTKGRLISVYGCGGDRDRTKRPIMGRIGSDLSDIAIITSDNPRTEDPSLIIKDILEGIKKDNYIVVEGRRDAIKKAMEMAKENDVIVVAGKGHEDYQILKDRTIHFDEREVIKEIIKEI
ncbi:UDP-N-acetylmuramoyl-L-alanyl-D-glutamate--2,6-diaminopimelate ligase [Clostridium tepidum]|jgi:UDP-N-acetylmuramoyl-L-alanyl-D-glutamate--2,6-diaminopimelate ligase|uniref:UDP-N-acetylmuramoyl-L-alanyl-D-glutamate--2,6-diaminopimelate ligase n=1 Tax=Clostridium tepidum TaxID=1962263 RepID=A0A1S9I969_9CLOT|nr:UDP-N-acetylmuramoyl-L-alanyl-D-glutamate--2,6-diaminopimelate ligase [Clostridium tepidum]MCR1933233.1 UDP-N-acetylmuramoyl-L-alanyl-D-glutamate--2,6-diaminopimelate ligase [Clostridium tepidum]MDU6877395.1 UDP-N-acetylmuramoyl-L-alanyl-D-glutamate--2,6-diaminopimelate ligase [Clostridium botulinum]OOO62712.1 UDP-N-acetylmuramoyl-L-alanyl-D-glutamate--2,6-diaminopimelate ligase [Clostridium tepidum]OOO66813.1 UDP-N-acetylmuramoyl-L-alanyl-D-glutamate--2,6-diaminopimelate ligase [Clostridium